MKNRARYIIAATLAGLMVGGIGLTTASAAVVGYWRMEDSSNLGKDSGPNGLDLTNSVTGTGTAPVAYAAHPATGAGSSFSNPIPQTGQPNTGQAVWNSTPIAGQSLSRGDSTAFAVSSFTVEAYVDPSALPANYAVIAGQWISSSNQRSYMLYINGTGNLTLAVSPTGGTVQNTDFFFIDSGFNLTLNKDYYVAASFDLSKSGTGNGGVTFYIQNLTDHGALQTVSKDHSLSQLKNSTGQFIIGTLNGTGASTVSYDWRGVIDEVRLSNTALSRSELLVPEPASLALLGLGGAALLMRRRQR